MDTGAQSTILSSDVAEATKVARVVDESESVQLNSLFHCRLIFMVLEVVVLWEWSTPMISASRVNILL